MGADVSRPVVREVAPDSVRSARFDDLYATYRELYPATAHLMHGLSRHEG
jgi:xylulokinase